MMAVTNIPRNATWWRWTAAAGAARMPGAMALLGLVCLGRGATGSYAVGAAMAAVYALSEALSAPWRGRALDRLSPHARRAAISRSLRASALALSLLAGAGYFHAPSPVLLVLAALAAAVPAGVPGGYRALLAELLDEPALPAAFSWDAAILEIEWLLAPLLVSAALLSGQPSAAVLVMAGFALGAAWATQLLPPSLEEPAEHRTNQVGAWRQLQAWPSFVTSLSLGIAEGGLIAVLPALLIDLGNPAPFAGAVAAVIAASSALGGAALGALGHRLPGAPGVQADWALVSMCLLMLPAGLATTMSHLVILLACGGAFIAPVNALRAQALQSALPRDQHSEGFSIQNGANGIGVAIGAAIAAALGPFPASALTTSLLVALLAVAGTTMFRYLFRATP
jgi:hypothetical protein